LSVAFFSAALFANGSHKSAYKKPGGVMDDVAGWFERRGEIPLAPPPRLREYVPLSDDPDPADATYPVDAVRGLAFALEYCDSRGWVSTRTVRCLAVDPEAPVFLSAFCNARRTTRTFRLDRIVAIGELRTGRILTADQHSMLLGPYLGMEKSDPRVRMLAELRQATKDGVFALLQLAMASGRLDAACRATILDYVKMEAEAVRCAMPAADAVELWIDNLSPPLDAVLTAVRTLLADKEKFARFLPFVLKVMRGLETYPNEGNAVRELMEAVRSHYRDEPADRATRALR
jgi:hypothetical protein